MNRGMTPAILTLVKQREKAKLRWITNAKRAVIAGAMVAQGQELLKTHGR